VDPGTDLEYDLSTAGATSIVFTNKTASGFRLWFAGSNVPSIYPNLKGYVQAIALGENSQDGTSGTSGLTGTSGTSGQDGTFFGSSGTSGSSGSSGTSGINGSSGTSGINGSSGTSGVVLALAARNLFYTGSDFVYDFSTSGNSSGSYVDVSFALPFASTDYSIDVLNRTTRFYI
jgi:hypothetical protein